MKRFWILVLVLSLLACGQPTQTDMVEALVAKPERLKELRSQCKCDHDKVGDAVCAAVSEATRRRFMGASKSSYADDPVLMPSSPAQPLSQPLSPQDESSVKD
jgi:hypothetical protein